MSPSIHTLEELLGGSGRIGVLRSLVCAQAPLTGRQVAARACLSHAGALRALDRLVEAGIVTRTPVGRAYLHQLDQGNEVVAALVIPLFEAEANVLPPPSPVPLPGLNPIVAPHAAAIEQACRRHHVTHAAVFGSATQAAADVVPNDVDVLVTFEPLEPMMKAQEYAALAAELEQIMGMPVDVMVSSAIRNPYLAHEIERTKVVLYEVA